MATYAIGDIQGCFTELLDLLKLINFSTESDQLWFAGDLVNRGPQSLETLRFIKSLGDRAIVVLGNHDIHLLAAVQANKNRSKDSFDQIFSAADRGELIDWLCQQRLFYHDSKLGYSMVHAGLAPQWDLKTAQALSTEIEQVLKGEQCSEYLKNIYGDQPDQWSDDLKGLDRLRCSTNFFTRLRFCDQQGRMDFIAKGPPGSQSENLLPWYEVSNRKSAAEKIIFGHWSTHKLKEKSVSLHNIFPIDTGCLWGGQLTALRLEDETFFQLDCNHRTSV